MIRFYFFILFIVVLVNTLACQTNIDSLKIISPHKASVLSAIMPGLGQAYNKQYWKLPIIYGGGVCFFYAIKNNYNSYTDYRDAYNAEVDNDPSTINPHPQYDQNALALFRDSYRRNLDLSIIGATLIYLLNIVDANVNAHLYYFRINKDLELSWHPSLSSEKLLSLNLRF